MAAGCPQRSLHPKRYYTHAIQIALVPFLNPELYPGIAGAGSSGGGNGSGGDSGGGGSGSGSGGSGGSGAMLAFPWDGLC